MKNSPAKPSLTPELGKRLAALPKDRLQAILTAAARRAKRVADREATGQTDLTKPFDPTIKPIKSQG